jgi:hypothetical protein
MTPKIPEELKADLKAKIDAYYEARKRELVRDLELEHQQALAWLAGDSNEDAVPAPLTNGSSGALTRRQMAGARTRRQMIQTLLPEFRDQTFTQADIRDKILERWPDTETKYLASRISQLLREMADAGQLGREREGTRSHDPWTYWVKEDSEDTLLKSGP